MVSNCLPCKVELKEANKTKEHIIPQSIGGRRTIKGFICVGCNSKTGNGWDAAVAETFSGLALHCRIKRHRNALPAKLFETVSSGKVWLNPDGKLFPGKPTYEKTPSETGASIVLRAKDIPSVKQIAGKLIKEHPEVKLEDVMAQAREECTYLNDYVIIPLNYGGPERGRSFVKTTLALCAEAGINSRSAEKALNYLLGEDSEACYTFYYSRDLVVERPAESILHVVSIQGDPETGLLLGYVEYFSTCRVVVVLSEDYSGDRIQHSYSLDPIAGCELNVTVSFPFDRDNIRKIFIDEETAKQGLSEALADTLRIAQNRSVNAEIRKICEVTLEEVAKELRMTTRALLSNNHPLFYERLQSKMTPFIEHLAMLTLKNLFRQLSGRFDSNISFIMVIEDLARAYGNQNLALHGHD